MSDQIQAFHDHLDKCPQCRESPFELCDKGSDLKEGVLGNSFQQQYPGPGCNPFDRYCLCGHPIESHTKIGGERLGRCFGTAEENCTCMRYKQKERADG